MKNSKIAIDARVINERPVGIARYAFQLICGISKLQNVDLFCIINETHIEKMFRKKGITNITCIYVKSKPLSVLEHIEIPLVLFKHRIKLFHATSYMTPIWVPCRFIYSILDTYHLIFPQGFSRFAQIYFKVIVKTAAFNAKTIITISNSSRADILKFITFRRMIAVTYLGFEEKDHNVKPFRAIQEKYSLPDDKYILYIGNHRYHKNSERVLEAYSRLCLTTHVPPRLFVNLVETRERRQLLTNDMASNQVCFLGFIAEEDIFSFYTYALCLVVPSLYEGFGLFILEAMAAGTPVITSNVSSMPEVGGDAVLYVDPYNVFEIEKAMRCIVSDENLRNDLIRKGHIQRKLFSWEKCVTETMEIYNRVLNSSETVRQTQ